jgi:hypothetical protein
MWRPLLTALGVLVAALAGSGLMAQRQSPPTGGFEMGLSASGFQYVDDKETSADKIGCATPFPRWVQSGSAVPRRAK